MVAEFISTLLRANAAQQEAFYGKQIPRVVFKEYQAEIRWIYDYRNRNRHYPSLASFRSRFPNFKILKTKDTVETAFQAVLDAHLFSEVATLVDKAKQLRTGGRTMQEVIGFMRQATQEISTFDAGYIDVDVSKSDIALKAYLDRVKNHQQGLTIDPSPWPSYNELVAYCEPGEHNIITSRTSIGKTWYALWWAHHFAECGERVLIVSKEMPTSQVAVRYECIKYKLSHPKIRKGKLSPSELGRWKRERRNNPPKNIILTGQETITGVGFSHIISKIQQHRPTVLIVDGAYLILPEGLSRNAGPVEKFTAISNTMKRLCMAFKLIGFSIIQVNREAEGKSGDTTPSLKNIYGADAWAQDADNVFIIGGKRGSSSRVNSLAKGRESNVGEFSTRFQLDPYPDFGEVKTLQSVTKSGAVEFEGV